MSTPSPSPTPLQVEMVGEGGFWTNETFIAVVIGGLITLVAQFVTMRQQRKTDLAKEFREVRRGLYVKVALHFDEMNHLLLHVIGIDKGQITPSSTNEVADSLRKFTQVANDLTRLATEVGLTGADSVKDLVHQSASRPMLPKSRQNSNVATIDTFTPEELDEYRMNLEKLRFKIDKRMRSDLDFLSGRRRRPWSRKA